MDDPVSTLKTRVSTQTTITIEKTTEIEKTSHTDETNHQPLQKNEEKKDVLREDPILEINERVREHMPPVEEVEHQARKLSYDRADATEQLERTQKFFGDSSLMKQIKKDMGVLNDFMLVEMPKDRSQFIREMETRCIRYEMLYRQCQKYVRERSGTRREPGMTRLQLIREIGDYLQQEREHFEEHARQIYESSREEQLMPRWTQVLDSARTLQVADIGAGQEFVQMREEQSENMKKRSAVSRLAKLLGMDQLVESVQKTAVGQGEQKRTGYLIGNKPAMSMAQLKAAHSAANQNSGENGAEPEKQVEITYENHVLRDLLRIRDLDRMLGISRSDSDLAVSYEEQQKDGKTVWLINSVMAVNNEKILENAKPQAAELEIVQTDREFASRLLSLPPEFLKGALLDLLPEEALKQVSSYIKAMKKMLSAKTADYLNLTSYSLYNVPLLKKIKSSFGIGYIKGSNVEEMNVRDYDSTIVKPPLQELPGQRYLRMYVDADLEDQQTVKSEAWKNMMEASRTYFEEWDHGTTGVKMIDTVRNMLSVLRQWSELPVTDQYERAALTNYQSLVCTTFGKSVLYKEEVPLSDGEGYDKQILESASLVKEKVKKDTSGVLDLRKRFDEPLFLHLPCVEDIKQGRLGDCYFLSALCAIVERTPEAIMDMMQDNGDSVTVTFPGKKKVTVSKKVVSLYEKKPEQAEGSVSAQTGGDLSDHESEHGAYKRDWYARETLWVQIMEKAYVKAGFRWHNHILASGDSDLIKAFEEKYNGIILNLSPELSLINMKYANSLECLSGGHSSTVLTDIMKADYEDHSVKMHTVDNMDSAYEKMWKRAASYQAADPALAMPEWRDIRSFLRKRLEGPLKMELKFRQSAAFSNKEKAARAAFRTVTVEDIQDTLKDLRSWRQVNEADGYERILIDLRKTFPALDITSEVFDHYLEVLADELSQASAGAKDELEHRRQVEDTDTGKYSRNAVDTFKKIQQAFTERKLVLASTKTFSPLRHSKGNGLNGEQTREGMAQSHAYTVLNCREEDTPKGKRYFIKLHNPWGTMIPRYGQLTEIDGTKHAVAYANFEGTTSGIFELDLNDFMQFIGHFSISKKGIRAGKMK